MLRKDNHRLFRLPEFDQILRKLHHFDSLPATHV